jgi:hypothetical protein
MKKNIKILLLGFQVKLLEKIGELNHILKRLEEKIGNCTDDEKRYEYVMLFDMANSIKRLNELAYRDLLSNSTEEAVVKLFEAQAIEFMIDEAIYDFD